MPTVECQDSNLIRTERTSNILHTHLASWLENVGLVPASVDGRFLWPLRLCRTIFWEFHTPWLSVCQIWKSVFAHRLSRPVSAILQEQHDLILVSKQKEHWAPVHGVLFYYNMIRTGEYFSIFLFCSLFNNVIIWEWSESVNLDYSNMVGRERFPRDQLLFFLYLLFGLLLFPRTFSAGTFSSKPQV